MKHPSILFTLLVLIIISCTTDETLFEKGTWWEGHWQDIENPSAILSIGHTPVGPNAIVTTQFFITLNDSIIDHFILDELEDFDHKDLIKTIKTDSDTYIRIEEVDESKIDVYGPSDQPEDLETKITNYRRLPDDIIAPIPDSLLYVI